MELIEYLKTNNIDDFKKDNIKVYTFKNLKLLKYNYDKKQDKEYQKYCKGCIIDKDSKRILCVPPKQSEIYDNQSIDDTYIIQDLIDGTMINIFYANNKWNFSTRSEIGGSNKWTCKSFIKLFEDICDFDKVTSCLTKNYSYSFVLRHKSNKCVSNIEKNSIVLVDIFDLSINEYIDNLYKHFSTVVPFEIINTYTCPPLPIDIDRLKNINMNHNWKGFIIKKNTIRYKHINPEYMKVKNITVNSNNKLYIYIKCIQDNTLNKYLKINPEYKEDFNNYRYYIEIIVNELYDNYCKYNINKTIKYKEIPYQLRPLINIIHNEYIIKNKRIDQKFIKYKFLHFNIKRIMFVMNYYI